MNNAYSSYFIVIYEYAFTFFGNKLFAYRIFSKPSSVVEHTTADRDVGGSIPLAPFCFIMGYLSKDT